ncbi:MULTISPECIES: hypothetical protein [unclassified Hoeflea]|uniref:hypothetical protein n=1 Tax=unclassified Hoeflea TaxID=2614931 RepID=UPI00398FBA74
MRFVARVLSLLLLVVAVIAGLVDAIQSVAANRPVLTPLIEAWTATSPDTLALLSDLFADRLPGWAWDPAALWVLGQPAFAVFLALSLIFYLIGYRRPKAAGRFAV